MFDLSEGFLHATLAQSGRKWPFSASGEADETMCVIFQFFFSDCAFAFLSAQLHFGDQTAEILVAGAGSDEERKAGRIVIPMGFVILVEGFVIPSGARNPYPRHIFLWVGILRLRRA